MDQDPCSNRCILDGPNGIAEQRDVSMTSEPTPLMDDPIGAEPTEAELEEWAERERKRRAAWLAGPTPEERAAYAAAERDRRASGSRVRMPGAPSSPG